MAFAIFYVAFLGLARLFFFLIGLRSTFEATEFEERRRKTNDSNFFFSPNVLDAVIGEKSDRRRKREETKNFFFPSSFSQR